MIELGQLEAAHAEFDKHNTQVVVVSLEDPETAKQTQTDFPHLRVVADASRGLADAVQVIHAQSGPDGGDTTAPTTLVLDGAGKVRWTYRPERFVTRLQPKDLLQVLDEQTSGH